MEEQTVEDTWMKKRRGDGQMDERDGSRIVGHTQERYTIVQPRIGYFEAAPPAKIEFYFR
jgi:hypothetical protein